ncbi:MAG TPA: S8 family serine peptidase, partial [bacterium]
MKKRRFIIWVMIGILVMLHLSSPSFLDAEDQNHDLSSSKFPPHTRDELIIQFTPETKIEFPKNQNSTLVTGIAQLDSLNSIRNVKAIVPLVALPNNSETKSYTARLARIYVIKFSKTTDVTKLIHHYKKLPFVENVEVNQVYYSHGSKTKQAVTIDQSQLAEAASLIEHKNQIIIGIIDTGIDWQKKRLLSNLWKNPRELLDGLDNDANGFVDDIWGWNFVDPEMMQESGLQWKNKPEDNCGHGSIIADICNQISNYQSGKNNSKMNRLMIIKAGFATADGTIIFTTAATARSIIYAANHGANIINISWGSEFPSMILQQAINYAIDKGCLIIASAGNDNSQGLNYPAALENVCAVAAIDSTNKKLSPSNYGYWIDVAAPGVMRIQDTLVANVSGTSLAAAYVSGLAGLAAGCGRSFNADSLRAKITWSCDNIYQNNPAYFGQLGAGKINLKRALLSEFRPNVIIQNCISLNRNQTFLPGEIIPLAVHVKNLSYPAKNVQIKLTTDDPIAELLNSQLTIPALDYGQKVSNESDPFKFIVKQTITNECNFQLKAYITAANGFSSFQEFTVAIGKSPPKNLTLINDSPVTLYWSGELKFISYHIYRRRDDQQSFARVTETPVLAANFIDNTADAGRYYHYFVTGIDQSNQETPASNIISLEAAAELRFVSSSTNDATQRIKIKSVFPPSDTILSRGDTLQFRCVLDAKHVGALKYSWILNDKLLNQANDSIYVLEADSLQYPKNSLKVAISDSDMVASFSWNIEITQQQAKLLFFPASDTTIAEGDTLKIRFEAGKHTRPTRAIKWLLNGTHDNFAVGNYYILTPSFNSAGVDTITLNYQSADTSLSHQWLVTILDRNCPPRILSFCPSQDTTITRNDTLKLSVNASDEDSDSLSFRWSVNGQIDSTAWNAFYLIAGSKQHTKTDTIVVAVADQDSSIQHTWLIHYLKRKNSIPRIISCQPSIDSTLSKTDSMRFQISCDDPDGDSLKFVWHLNSVVDTTACDSIYRYRTNRPSRYDDTLGVAISDADTTIKIEWILRAAFGRKADSFAATSYWFPEQDSIIAAGDSMIFSVNFPGDSSRFQWSINGVVDSSRSDSVFIYHPFRQASFIDTIKVLVVA